MPIFSSFKEYNDFKYILNNYFSWSSVVIDIKTIGLLHTYLVTSVGRISINTDKKDRNYYKIVSNVAHITPQQSRTSPAVIQRLKTSSARYCHNERPSNVIIMPSWAI
jgi:hypothetical protein